MTSLHSTPEQELADRVSRGDAAALAEIWRRTSGRAFRIALQILKSQTDVEEVLQNVFIEVWQRARSFDSSRGSLTNWVTNIAYSRAVDLKRATAAVATHSSSAREHLEEMKSARTTELPFDTLVVRQTQRQVNLAMRSLSNDQRKVIELAYFFGQPMRIIAEAAGVPLGTIKSRMRSALLKLAALLRPEG